MRPIKQEQDTGNWLASETTQSLLGTEAEEKSHLGLLTVSFHSVCSLTVHHRIEKNNPNLTGPYEKCFAQSKTRDKQARSVSGSTACKLLSRAHPHFCGFPLPPPTACTNTVKKRGTTYKVLILPASLSPKAIAAVGDCFTD